MVGYYERLDGTRRCRPAVPGATLNIKNKGQSQSPQLGYLREVLVMIPRELPEEALRHEGG